MNLETVIIIFPLGLTPDSKNKMPHSVSDNRLPFHHLHHFTFPLKEYVLSRNISWFHFLDQ